MIDTTYIHYTRASKNAKLILENGLSFEGFGLGAPGVAIGELCFQTSHTGYQEIITDPSFAKQILCFTFPHIGNVGCNNQDYEHDKIHLSGIILAHPPRAASNHRAEYEFSDWLKTHNVTGIAGIDTRRLTHIVREEGHLKAAIMYDDVCEADITKDMHNWPGLHHLDLAKEVTTKEPISHTSHAHSEAYHVVVIDYGAKANIIHSLKTLKADVTIVPSTASFAEIMAFNPHGILLSNGPGDPFATNLYAQKTIQDILKANIPLMGICLGHQLLALSLGAKTFKMEQGHRGANHPVLDLALSRVMITSQNHGFCVDRDSLPKHVVETHRSLFDQTLEGIKIKDKPVFSVQFHPEASPGPHDSFYLFETFIKNIQQYQHAKTN